ncbi:MAG: hypothetical protein JXR83_01245 [Deltaproteobacteria bacterium]|nr:hypothetical protein [Deltaproteobacteria bacterium]
MDRAETEARGQPPQRRTVLHPVAAVSMLVLAAVGVAIAACGYQLTRGGALPAGVDRVQIEPFLDRTAEGELGVLVATAVRDRFRAVDPALVAGLGDRAAARLQGIIEEVRVGAVPMGRGGGVVAGLYQLSIDASARIVTAGGALVQDLGRFSEGVEYPVESGVGASEESRRRALLRAARALGARIADAALTRF